jgi:hypothetical protein
MVRMRSEPDTNVFVASRSEAATGASSAAADGITGADLRGVYLEAIAALHHVIIGRDYEPDRIDLTVLASHEEVFVYTVEHGGWLYKFPDNVVRHLAAIKDSDRRAIADKWSKVFRNNAQPPTLEEVDHMLSQIASLAQTSVRQEKSLFWRQESC